MHVSWHFFCKKNRGSIICNGDVFFFQYSKLDSVYKFITIVIYVAMALVEVTRLYLGYAGNLQEKVF